MTVYHATRERKKASLVYENICRRCNEGAGGKKELPVVKEGSIYIGESSRTLHERSKEHQKDWETKKEKSHIAKHQGATHTLGEEPDFIIRPVRFFKTAFSRQIGEAIRIRRRGGAGAILNSKAEYSRCRIPRLVLEEVDVEEEEREEQKYREEYKKSVEEHAECWGAKAWQIRKEDVRKLWEEERKTTGSQKRAVKPPEEQRKTKKRIFLPAEDRWGEKKQEHAEGEGNPLIPPSNIPLMSTTTKDMCSLAKREYMSEFSGFS